MAEPAAPRKTRPKYPTLDAAHEVIRALGLRGGKEDPPQEDAGADSDLEIIPEPPADSTPPEPTPLAGSVPALCSRGNGATAPEKTGAPSNTPDPALMTKRCPRWGTRPHTPPCATGWRRAGFWMRPRAAV